MPLWTKGGVFYIDSRPLAVTPSIATRDVVDAFEEAVEKSFADAATAAVANGAPPRKMEAESEAVRAEAEAKIRREYEGCFAVGANLRETTGEPVYVAYVKTDAVGRSLFASAGVSRSLAERAAARYETWSVFPATERDAAVAKAKEYGDLYSISFVEPTVEIARL